ncbi:torsin-4A-like [Myxocyprinus asiaticus]|uniref:torsin-4A-like n=1 Tax=Myxocyprinus asiaticus TaxID=70543 RepID=UPI0022235F69|nr:torsin-4A-like [Myxocyprinus asiaticus]
MADTDCEGVSMDAQVEKEREEEGGQRTSLLSPQLKAMIRIKKKYLKKPKAERGSNSVRLGHYTNSVNVTSDWALHPKSPQTRKSKRRNTRVLFPNDTLMFKPKKERSRAKPFLILFSVIVFVQVYNAIENLDDHVLKYDLEGLERTLHREMFGQHEALDELMDHLNDYLSTYAHQQPLALSLHGASGVGKSHLGRLIARHFRSVVDDKLVMQYFSKHHCSLQESAQHCASELTKRVVDIVTHAEDEEQIPFIILDDVDLMQPPLLDVLQTFLESDQTNEFLNVVYIFLSSLGQREITAHILLNASTAGAEKPLRNALSLIHPLWMEPAVELIPLSLLEREHIMQCFLEEMTLEGFYPDLSHVERLADELAYHRAAGRQYAKTGCKQVVGKVNLL